MTSAVAQIASSTPKYSGVDSQCDSPDAWYKGGATAHAFGGLGSRSNTEPLRLQMPWRPPHAAARPNSTVKGPCAALATNGRAVATKPSAIVRATVPRTARSMGTLRPIAARALIDGSGNPPGPPGPP